MCLVTIKYKNPSATYKTIPQKYVFDNKENISSKYFYFSQMEIYILKKYLSN